MHKTYIMKCILKSIVTIIVLSVLISCSDRYNVKRTMVEFTKSEIILPDRLTFVKNGECSTINSSELINDNMLIIYVDSTSCSACKISHFSDMLPLYHKYHSCHIFHLQHNPQPTSDTLYCSHGCLCQGRFF